MQEFISAARSTRDLWSGSYLIAHLSTCGLKYIADTFGVESILFPVAQDQQVFKYLSEKGKLGQPTIPNRFLLSVPYEKSREIAAEIKATIQREWQDISDTCFQWFAENCPVSANKYAKRWQQQAEMLLQFSWQAVPCRAGNWADSYNSVNLLLAARRNTRDFQQFITDDQQDGAPKDPLNGKDETVFDSFGESLREWQQLTRKQGLLFKDNEKPYGAITMIKRLWLRAFLEAENQVRVQDLETLKKNTTGESKEYVAVLAMDGDRMGAALSAATTPEELKQISKKLARFTNKRAQGIVEEHKGTLIYAGGDDVLALLPACKAIDCAEELRKAFRDETGDSLTASVGICFGFYKTPLQLLIQEAHHAEHLAKSKYERNSLALVIRKHSGEIMEWGANFDSAAWQLFHQFQQLTQDKVLSGRFAYAMAAFLRPYAMEHFQGASEEHDGYRMKNEFGDKISPILMTDFERICERQKIAGAKLPEDFLTNSRKYLEETIKTPENFVKLYLCAIFLMRKKEGN